MPEPTKVPTKVPTKQNASTKKRSEVWGLGRQGRREAYVRKSRCVDTVHQLPDALPGRTSDDGHEQQGCAGRTAAESVRRRIS
ncbi:hypothetical protein BC936DRAFT_140074 [Jimgerdemannia flammicorona]|uniref:Uncharacterized protein n=1 Tax=Jimgerdemannia flammicorona TaxID=994334 RepID=A0A433DH68_9FUNG|nr:hypothetical protein BC936DRAFT_140074 [Jimgerdemannia flammicorona]